MTQVWKTKSGEEIPISHMDNEHLLNVAKMLLRNADKLKFQEEARTIMQIAFCNGEMAQDAIENEYETLLSMSSKGFIEEKYDGIFVEIKKRKLTL